MLDESKKTFSNLCEAFKIRIEALLGNNTACQWLECYYRTFSKNVRRIEMIKFWKFSKDC